MVCSAFQPLKKRGFRQTCTQLFVISQLRLLYVDAPIPIRRQNEQIITPKFSSISYILSLLRILLPLYLARETTEQPSPWCAEGVV